MPLSISIATRIRHQHQSLKDLVAGCSDTDLQTVVNPGKWTPFQQIAHLAAYQPVFIDRLDRILTENEPVFERYVGDNDPAFPVMQTLTTAGLLQRIEENGLAIAEKLQTWDDAMLTRKALHPKYGLLDVGQWAEFYVLHEAHHLFAIFMMVQDLRSRREQ